MSAGQAAWGQASSGRVRKHGEQAAAGCASMASTLRQGAQAWQASRGKVRKQAVGEQGEEWCGVMGKKDEGTQASSGKAGLSAGWAGSGETCMRWQTPMRSPELY